jgi:ketosteroid isomerase-like protein
MTGIAASPLVVAGREAEAAGAKVVIDCVDVIELRDGLVARKDTYLDATALLGDAQGS